MKYLSRVKDVTMINRLRHMNIQEELGTKPITEFIENRQLSWCGHLIRMEDKRQVKLISTTRVKVNRGTVRPRDKFV